MSVPPDSGPCQTILCAATQCLAQCKVIRRSSTKYLLLWGLNLRKYFSRRESVTSVSPSSQLWKLVSAVSLAHLRHGRYQKKNKRRIIETKKTVAGQGKGSKSELAILRSVHFVLPETWEFWHYNRLEVNEGLTRQLHLCRDKETEPQRG